VTGANYSGFKDLLKAGKHLNMGFPIAEIDHLGGIVVTKEKNTGGCVNIATVTSQLIYEIQGPLYYNSDATADIENVQMSLLGEDRVRVSGVKGKSGAFSEQLGRAFAFDQTSLLTKFEGLPPPTTTKIGYV
jgi:hypothetical protein